MPNNNRDLLVLTKRDSMNPSELEHEVEMIVDVLFHVESMMSFCIANEIADVNRSKIITKPAQVFEVVQGKPKSFVFISNKN